ncbi:MAG: hypothetical protein OEV59_04360 [Deltaproteobacteria bacterium]|nr:hypothetical protein [Deltaproteobacteria bacterium]
MFSKIYGQKNALDMLRRSVSADRVAHAYVFFGPEGVGKRKAALAFAAALNCERYEDSNEACGGCEPCRASFAGANMNIINIAPEDKTLKADEIRDLQRALRYKAETGRVVAIVDAAETMQKSAANVFLKTLEEPPGNAVIILVSSKLYSMLPTILSRCQRVAFSALKASEMAPIVEKTCGVSSEDALAAARLGNGSVSRSIRMIEDGMIERRREFFEKFASARGSVLALIGFAENLAKDESLTEMLEFLKSRLRDLAVTAAGCPELAAEGLTASSVNTQDAYAKAFFEVEHSLGRISVPYYDNAQLAMEALLARMAGRAG